MSDTARFDVVFRGDIAPGQKIMDVRERVQKLFKADEQQLQRLFSGRPVTIRRDLDRAQAQQYQQALLQAGALVELKPGPGGIATPETPVSAPKAGAAPERSHSSVAATETPAQSQPEAGDEFTLAPVGADMLREEDRPLVEALEVDISGLSAEAPDGDLLDESEKKHVEAVAVDISHLSVEKLPPE